MSLNYTIYGIKEKPELLTQAAEWFHEKWGVPLDAYRQSMEQGLQGGAVPAWYIAMQNGRIIGGLGVIDNDFHDRPDLSPNVCAVYVEEDFRSNGIAGDMLRRVCADMKRQGIDTLYLVTFHVGFYERYGWEYLCMVNGDGEDEPSRMYVHREQ